MVFSAPKASLTYLPTTQAWRPLASAPPESGSFRPVSRFSPIPTPFIGLQMYSGRLDKHDWWYICMQFWTPIFFYRHKTVLVSPWLCYIDKRPVSRFSPIPVYPRSFCLHLLIVL
jgi:hypothetical protein